MKAVVFSNYGAPSVLRVAELAKPAPADNEVLIRVRAAEVTKADTEMRRSSFPVKWFWLPMRLFMGPLKPRKPVLGGYFAGEVEAVGPSVEKYKIGDEIFGSAGVRFGAHGEYICLPENYLMVGKPVNLSFEEAASVPLGGLNAIHFMRRAEVKPGESVLINGAGGSIGIFSLQIAKAMGAGEITVVDSTIKEQMLRSIGADHFIDYKKTYFADHRKKYDVILNMVAGIPFTDCINALHDGGRYLMGNPKISDMLRAAVLPKSSKKTAIFAFAGEKEEELLALKKMLERKEISPVVDQVFPFEEAAEAHWRVEQERRLGAVVLVPKRTEQS